MDPKKNKILLGSAIGGSLLVTVTGLSFYLLHHDKPETPKGEFFDQTAIAAPITKIGTIALLPSPIALVRNVAGQLGATTTLSVRDQDFTLKSISISGDKRLTIASTTCGDAGATIHAGQSCDIVLSYKETDAADPQARPVPQITILGDTRTPGGDHVATDTKADISGATAGAANAGGASPAANGLPGFTPAGPGDGLGTKPAPITPASGTQVAPGNIDPYGPVTATNSSRPDPNAPLPMTPRERAAMERQQFVEGRRVAIFSGIQPRGSSTASGAAASKDDGSWENLSIPTSESSYPHDMSRVVTMDRIITAVILRTYDSRSQNTVVAQVDRNVYSAQGRNILIPRGTQIIGTGVGGQIDRAAITWHQMIRPDGARFIIEGLAGDAQGAGGVPGYVNERLGRRYGSILLGTALNSAIAVGLKAKTSTSGGLDGGTSQSNGAIVSDIVRQDLNKITADILQRNANLQTVITVPAGTRVTVIPTQDLLLRPLKGPTETRVTYPRPAQGAVPPPAKDTANSTNSWNSN